MEDEHGAHREHSKPSGEFCANCIDQHEEPPRQLQYVILKDLRAVFTCLIVLSKEANHGLLRKVRQIPEQHQEASISPYDGTPAVIARKK